MNINDFRYIHQGKPRGHLSDKDAHILNPINQRSTTRHYALLALHGFSSSPAVFRSLLPKLVHYDAVVCPTLQGHGQSITAFSRATAQEWLDQTHTICADLLKEYARVDVLGLSLGGLLACKLSQSFHLNHLYLLAPALKLHINARAMSQLARCFKYLGFVHLRNRAGTILNPQQAELTYRKLPLNAIVEILNLVDEFQWQPPHCPIDLFLGRKDSVVNSTAVQKIFAPLSNARIHWLADSAHVLTLDNDLNEISACINAQA